MLLPVPKPHLIRLAQVGVWEKKVFEVNRKITHGRDVLYWPGRALIVLQIFFSLFLVSFFFSVLG